MARRLFERVTALRLSSKKMKFFFKRCAIVSRALLVEAPVRAQPLLPHHPRIYPPLTPYTHPLTRYLAYARAAADDELVEHVKEKARAWVESAAAQE